MAYKLKIPKKTIYWEDYNDYGIHVDTMKGYALAVPKSARVIMHTMVEGETVKFAIEQLKKTIDGK